MLADLRTHLLADSAVATLFGTRLYHVALPQGVVYPAASLNVVSTQRLGVLDRATTTPGLTQSRVQCDVYADSYLNADAAANTILAVTEAVARDTVGSTLFFGIETEDVQTSIDPGPEDGSRVYRVRVDLMTSHKEA